MSQEMSSSCAVSGDACCTCGSSPGGAAVAPSAASAGATQRSVILIEKMDCPTEEALIRKQLANIPGVTDLSFNLLARQLTVEHAPGRLDEVMTALDEVGMGGTVQAAAAPSLRSTIRIEKMDCPTEEALIRKRLGAMPDLRDLSFDLLGRKLTVSHAADGLAKVLLALNEAGMHGQVVSGQTGPAAAPAKRHWARENWKLLAGGAAAAAAELAALAVGDLSVPALALSVLALGLTGPGVYRKGWIALKHRTLNINALMSIAVTGALVIGQWPEAGMVMFLFALAEAIEARSLQRAQRAVETLLGLAPETATVRIGSQWETMPAASVAVGSVLRVRPGERIPLDGRVTSGSSTVDQAHITGESVPVDKAEGDPLYAGTINQDSELEFEATALASNSTLARIVRAVHEAQSTRAPTQRFVDRFATYYTPAVVGIALVVAVLPPLVAGADWLTWVYRALVMLVVACPCALVISTPVTVVSGLTGAARRGILIKGGLFLEGGDKLTVLALDKTGTLTHGEPTVTDVITLRGKESEQMRVAVALSSRSDHPVSKAIAAHGRDVSDHPKVSDFTALRGRGVAGVIGAVRYSLGNHRHVEEAGACSPELEGLLRSLEEQGKTAVVLIGDNQPLAIFAIADAVRAESAQAVQELKQLGIRPVMLTGDNRHTAQAIARQVGIEDVRSELLPEAKLDAIAQLQSNGESVGMVGDGINDAPALAKADIGFAMAAAGTDTAIETANVALMDDDPRKLAAFVRWSRATNAVLQQNIALAIGIKVVFLALTVAGQATLWMAVFADMGSSLIVIFNGMRLLKNGRAKEMAH
ncbi:MAG: heavy metal translocating P-type ATPase [Ramlibacter sp.]